MGEHRDIQPPSTKAAKALFTAGSELAAYRNLREVVLEHIGMAHPREVSSLTSRVMDLTKRINELEALLIADESNKRWHEQSGSQT